MRLGAQRFKTRQTVLYRGVYIDELARALYGSRAFIKAGLSLLQKLCSLLGRNILKRSDLLAKSVKRPLRLACAVFLCVCYIFTVSLLAYILRIGKVAQICFFYLRRIFHSQYLRPCLVCALRRAIRKSFLLSRRQISHRPYISLSRRAGVLYFGQIKLHRLGYILLRRLSPDSVKASLAADISYISLSFVRGRGYSRHGRVTLQSKLFKISLSCRLSKISKGSQPISVGKVYLRE